MGHFGTNHESRSARIRSTISAWAPSSIRPSRTPWNRNRVRSASGTGLTGSWRQRAPAAPSPATATMAASFILASDEPLDPDFHFGVIRGREDLLQDRLGEPAVRGERFHGRLANLE